MFPIMRLVGQCALLAVVQVIQVSHATAVPLMSISVKRPVRRPHMERGAAVRNKLRSAGRRAAAHRHPLVAVGCNRVVYHIGMGIGEPVQEVAVRQPHFAVDIAVFINGLIVVCCFYRSMRTCCRTRIRTYTSQTFTSWFIASRY